MQQRAWGAKPTVGGGSRGRTGARPLTHSPPARADRGAAAAHGSITGRRERGKKSGHVGKNRLFPSSLHSRPGSRAVCTSRNGNYNCQKKLRLNFGHVSSSSDFDDESGGNSCSGSPWIKGAASFLLKRQVCFAVQKRGKSGRSIPRLASSESGRRHGAPRQPLHVQQHDELALHGAAPSPPPATATAGSNSSSELERPSAILALLTLIKSLY